MGVRVDATQADSKTTKVEKVFDEFGEVAPKPRGVEVLQNAVTPSGVVGFL